MKSKEFEKKIKELGFNYIIELEDEESGLVVEYARNDEGQTVLCTSNNERYDIDSAWTGFTDLLSIQEQDEIYALFYEYTKTPVWDRGIDIKKKDRNYTEYSVVRD
ncbi:hypothetical protein P3U41_06050 [Mammaliicoccus sciuri]|uniref:hypothetical protein n=1 Tax=Mammaliicoccus sciuri TaxID=1296 RepID=UPI002B25689D|nr:hypothetical protein [Mammaliicoccus sciuri]WQL34333.1 hypothetical protein P3U41_06050 [Mammaliicoccus sciuri]WQL61272.1 hypothetical protein P3T96_06050 [Mammaliicoccus sciuri]